VKRQGTRIEQNAVSTMEKTTLSTQVNKDFGGYSQRRRDESQAPKVVVPFEDGEILMLDPGISPTSLQALGSGKRRQVKKQLETLQEDLRVLLGKIGV